jgi:hypothetical protein
LGLDLVEPVHIELSHERAEPGVPKILRQHQILKMPEIVDRERPPLSIPRHHFGVALILENVEELVDEGGDFGIF